MLRFVLRRLLETIPVMLLIVTAAFFMVRFVPGGPFLGEKSLPPEVQNNLEAHYGLDRPLWRQYVSYLGDLCPKRVLPHRLFADADRDGRWDFDAGGSDRDIDNDGRWDYDKGGSDRDLDNDNRRD